MALKIAVYDVDERQNAHVVNIPDYCLRCDTLLTSNDIIDKDGTVECSKCKLWHTLYKWL